MKLRNRIFHLIIGVVALQACARRMVDPSGSLDTPSPVVLEVVNHNWSDIGVLLIQGGRRVRILTVTAASNASVAVPYKLLGDGGEVRLEASPIGGNMVQRTDVLFARPGSIISWTLESDLRRSSIAIY